MKKGIQEIGKLCPPSFFLMMKVSCAGSKDFFDKKTAIRDCRPESDRNNEAYPQNMLPAGSQTAFGSVR